jgi:hypothetical protein
MWVGDNSPGVHLQVTDETYEGTQETVLNLTGDTIEVQFIGTDFEFSGDGAVIWPATVDPNGVNFWNCSYTFAEGDTAYADTYAIFVTTTNDGNVTTYATGDTLTIKAFPVTA